MKMLMKARTLKRFGVVGWRSLSACAGKAKNDVAVGPPPVEHIEMEPIKISAVKGPDGVHLETFDVASCSSTPGKALAEKRYDDAITRLRKAAARVPATTRTPGRACTTGGSPTRQEGLGKAADDFKKMADGPEFTRHQGRPLPAGRNLRRDGQLADVGEIFAQILERKDLTADDKIEALARRGFAQFQLKDLDTAERTFKSAL